MGVLILILTVLFLGPLLSPNVANAKDRGSAQEVVQPSRQTPLDEKVLIQDDSTLRDVLPSVSVIQRRAVVKTSKVLVQSFGSFDFSDAPISDQALGLSLGYNHANNFEWNIEFLPLHLTQEQNLATAVRSLTAASGEPARLTSPQPKSAYGASFVWDIAYGKENWGAGSIIRTETFMKLGGRMTTYENEKSTEKFYLLFGKTFLFAPAFNLRVAAGPGTSSFYVNGDKLNSLVALFEIGPLIYF